MRRYASLLTGGVVRLRHGLARAVRYLDYGLDAATLGLFPDSYLDALTVEHYRGARSYHSDEHNQKGLFDWEQAAVETHFGHPGTVLITSAGGGREAVALLKLGWRIVATECTPSLHAQLVHNLRDAVSAGTADARLAPPDHVCLERAPYNAAIVGWGAYTHLVGRDRRVTLLRALRAALRPGGALLLSFLPGRDSPMRHDRAITALANALRAPLRSRRVELGESTTQGDWRRLYVSGEVAAEVREAGLAIVAEHTTPYPHLIARRPRRTRA